MKNFIFIILSCFIFKNESCGITTHTEIAHRAATYFDYLIDNTISINQLIKQYQSAFQAGNPYPDSYYNSLCKKGKLSSVSEDTHWVPFLNATINYIRNTYKKPYNEDALRLIVFTLGYVSHQIADITWHSLGINQGFLAAMGNLNFHGSFDKAHATGDFGGDVINQFELSMSYISDLGDWFIPYKDLYNIYRQYYGAEIISEADIVECSSLLFLGRLGEQLGASLLYTNYSTRSTFLTNKLNDFFLGGIDDMATWTQISWEKALYMIENGVDKCKLDRNILYLQCNATRTRTRTIKSYDVKTFHNKNIFRFMLSSDYMTLKRLNNGIQISPSQKFQTALNLIKTIKNTPAKVQNIRYANSAYSNVSYYTLNDYATLGWSLATGDLNNDQAEDIIIGAPVYSFTNAYQNGRVYVMTSKNGLPLQNLNLDTNSDVIIDSPAAGLKSSKFGHSIVVLDLNLDGFMDIVISAPSYNLEDLKYSGEVYVYLGGPTQNFSTPSIILSCDEYVYCNYGWSLEKGDVNNDDHDDLIIGSPYANTCTEQCGLVSILFAKKTVYNSKLSISDMDWILTGNMAYEWFGFSLKAKFGYLVVGAPQSRICYRDDCVTNVNDIQAAGRVYLFNYPSKTPKIILNGTENFEQFGYDFDLSIQYDNIGVVAVASITKDCKIEKPISYRLRQGGIVQVFNISEPNNPNVVATLKSDRPYANFGSRIKFYDANSDGYEDLFIGAQLRTESGIMFNKVHEGRAYMFNGGKSFPIGNYTDDCPIEDLIPCTSQKASIVFENDESKSRFGNNFAFLRSANFPNATQIVISAARSDNLDSRLSGKIKIFNILK